MFDYKETFLHLRRGYDLDPCITLENISPEVEVLHITKRTRGLDLLPTFSRLRILNAHDISDLQFSQICTATQITHLASNIFGVTSLHPLRNLVNLRAVELTDNTKLTTLDGVEALAQLEVFALANCPITVDLGPISACKNLRFIWLSSSYTKSMRVNSLSPLSSLTKLECLKLTNVRAKDRQLTALHNLTNLVEIKLPNFFPRKELIALANALPNLSSKWLDAHVHKNS